MSDRAAPIPSCSNCVFEQQQGPHMLCTRNPPISSPLAPGNVAMWPVVTADDWCGAWAPYWNPANYAAATPGIANAAAGDIASISGSASNVIRLMRVAVTATANPTATADVSLVLRSGSNTGGTPSVLQGVPTDPLYPPPTAVVTTYATAPTAAPLVGMIRSQNTAIGPANQAQAGFPLIFLPVPETEAIAVLRGTANILCVLVTAVSQASWAVSMQWTESPQ